MIENIYESVIAHTDNFSFLKTKIIAAYFSKVRKYGRDNLKLKIRFITGILEQAVRELGILINAAYLSYLNHLTDLKIFGTEIVYKNRTNNNSSNNRMYRGKCTLITINTPLTQQVTILMSQLRTEKLAITLVFAL